MKYIKNAELITLHRKYKEEGCIESRNTIVTNFMAMARSIVSRYKYKQTPYADLLQAAYLGLIHAVDCWTPDKSFFSTYAWVAIQRNIRLELTKHSIIKVPSGKWNELEKNGLDLLAHNICFEYITMETEPAWEREFFTDDLGIHYYMQCLPKRLQDILELRLQGLPLVKIGQKHGVTKERIRQLIERSLKIIKETHFVDEHEIREYLKYLPVELRAVIELKLRGKTHSDIKRELKVSKRKVVKLEEKGYNTIRCCINTLS